MNYISFSILGGALFLSLGCFGLLSLFLECSIFLKQYALSQNGLLYYMIDGHFIHIPSVAGIASTR